MIPSQRGRRGYFDPSIKRGEPGVGQLRSIILGQALIADPELTISRLLGSQNRSIPIWRYSQLIGQDIRDFHSEASYTMWEYLKGTNLTVFADDAVANRYHVLVADKQGEATKYGCEVINSGGEILLDGEIENYRITQEDRAKIVEFYETIRNLPRFDPSHCPIIEMQRDENGKLWFLQYHRVRDAALSNFSVDSSDYPTSEGWLRADAVRGSLGEATLQLALWYPDHYGAKYSEQQLPTLEDASADWHYDHGLSEILSRRRQAFIDVGDFRYTYQNDAIGHDMRSKWFKPQLALAIDDRGLRGLVSEDIQGEVSTPIFREKKMARVVIDIVSDGINGFVRLNKSSEQPIFTDN